jgi:hypothetical protein
MPRRITPQTTVDNLKKEAKRWLKELRADDVEARTRLEQSYTNAPADPVLRDVQHALALEHGLPNWTALKQALADRPAGVASVANDIARYERLADDMVAVYANGDAAALQRINEHYQRSTTVDDLRAMVWRLVYKVRQAKGAAHAFGAAEAREMIARTDGFSNWDDLARSVAAGLPSAVPPYVIKHAENRIAPLRNLAPQEWDLITGVMKEQRIPALEAHGQMTDDVLHAISKLDHVTALSLGGSRELTDDGLLHLANMPQLEHLDLSEYPGGKLTDRGLEVLRHLPSLRVFKMNWQRGISDAGAGNLQFCDHLETVDLMGSPTGDGVIEALRGKANLRFLQTGRLVTDAGLAGIRDIPIFRSGLPRAVETDEEPTRLLIDGPFTNDGLASLTDLEGVFALDLFWHVTGITADGFATLIGMPNLMSLGCDGELCNDQSMHHIAAMPRLRKLRAQGSAATDDGFIALSRSASLERFWGREAPNLTGRGFAALANMPRLRALGVSCKRVDDAALATLPRFPALQELTPIDVSDAGFRHVGGCVKLERLSCMYCRDTTDTATEFIADLRLKSYYAGLTQITDRSLEIFGRMQSLESVELYETKGVTNAGLAHLTGLPRLREVTLTGLPGVTFAGTRVFPAGVRVEYNV